MRNALEACYPDSKRYSYHAYMVGIIALIPRDRRAQSFETVSPSLEQDDRLDFWGEVKYERIYDKY